VHSGVGFNSTQYYNQRMLSRMPNSPTLEGSRIKIQDGSLVVPDDPIIPFIEGDGSGPDIWRSAHRVIDAAVKIAYDGRRRINWVEVFAGEKAFNRFNTWLPDETLHAFSEYLVGIKGPLTTPVGGGIRSLNVALRKNLDLYVCLRPVRWFRIVPSPIRRPEQVNMVIFRENTEDIYTGIEFAAGSQQNERFLNLLKENFPEEFAKIRFPQDVGIGIKPISSEGSKRLVRAAIRWGLRNKRKRVTLVHKGNIMKFTEGAFCNWGYDVAESEFSETIYTQRQWEQTKQTLGEGAANIEMEKELAIGKIWMNDIITDASFDQTLQRPSDFDVLATTNLNGDYLSDALASQVGGIGIAPGANINFETGVAVFEATHGTAPRLANLDKANPSSVILSAEMMLRYLGWNEAADRIIDGLETVITDKFLTGDLYAMTDRATLAKTSEFGDAIIRVMSHS
jgi:isocitrate dehydrogenase